MGIKLKKMDWWSRECLGKSWCHCLDLCTTIFSNSNCTCKRYFLNLTVLDQNTLAVTVPWLHEMKPGTITAASLLLGKNIQGHIQPLAGQVITGWRGLFFSNQLLQPFLQVSLPEFLSTSSILLLSSRSYCWGLLPCLSYFLMNFPVDVPSCKTVKRSQGVKVEKLKNILQREEKCAEAKKFSDILTSLAAMWFSVHWSHHVTIIVLISSKYQK